MKITVLVPTYRRSQDLERCLIALQQQVRPVDEVLLTVRDTDSETWAFLASFRAEGLPLRTVTVTVPGVVAAMNLGFEASQGDIVAVTDDDAAPHPDWLKRIEAYFLADEMIGGVGGRDWVHQGETVETGSREVVGRIQWFGRLVSNHHLGVGASQEVDVLKGVNMSFRRAAIAELRCDERLKGTGAQVHFEVTFCLSVKERGWKLIYDPAIAVDHYVAQRFDEDGRESFSALAAVNIAHNETLVLLDHFSPIRRFVYLAWAVLVGTRMTPGFVQLLRLLPAEGSLAAQKYQACMQGRWQGWQTWNGARRNQLRRVYP
jgi:cellulose synthase/poly-beta-1,6-N-acetylglucosamine synthase-like glycosyltransferase